MTMNEKLRAGLRTADAQLRTEGYSEEDIKLISLMSSVQMIKWVSADAPIHNPLFPRAVEVALGIVKLANEIVGGEQK